MCLYFLKFVQNQFNKTVKTCRADNGTEFVNEKYSTVFKTLGIHQRSCAYSPQQNGVVERKHSHILEIVRALKIHAGIPIRFWGQCIQTALYLINRLPSSMIDMSPYEKLHNMKLFLKSFKSCRVSMLH